MKTKLPINHLFELLSHSQDMVILCATSRLARNLRLSIGHGRVKNDTSIWPTPPATTVESWLNAIGEQIALLGEVATDSVPDRVLSPFEERLVWKQSIESVGGENPALPLFDLHSLAKTSSDANALIKTWHLPVTGDAQSEETQQFIGWRKHFSDSCQKNGWADVAEYQKRVIGWLDQGDGTLPSHVVFAGFDTISPHLAQLQAVLVKRGVALSNLELEAIPTSGLRAVKCDDSNAECRAAVAWARNILETKPEARIGIVVADLEARRATIVPILDEALNPNALAGADDSPPQHYNVSLGVPLTRHEMVRAALALMRLLGRPQGIPLTEFGDLLRMPYWSADQTEADLRALVDSKLRERPGQTLSLAAALRLARTLGSDSKLLHHLSVLKEIQQKLAKSKAPSEWAVIFREALGNIGWPGERKHSSTEFQARSAFLEALAGFAELDAFLGAINISAAISELARLCKEKVFQPKTIGQPAVQVLGLLEATGAEFDALWVMGMNDQHWPPPARPNPLLSAELQRRHRTPGSSAEVQTEFARSIHARLLHSAPDITFSYAEKEGDRDLRASPLIADLLVRETPPDLTLASETFLHVESEGHEATAFERLDDHRAPPLAEGERVSGGSGLLKAQAICPAWAFYRYRLGAKKLETPTEGFDPSRRGTMVHAMLEKFWKEVKDLASLNALDAEQLKLAVANAAEFALKQFETGQGEALSATFRQLEANRLQRLCLEWLTTEQTEPREPFKVVACEEKHTVSLGQLQINLVIDRIDELIADGRRIVIDYKTGSTLDTKNWFGDRRITEPQLPLYAAIVLAQADQAPVAAVAFAKVRLRECGFAGVADQNGLAPGVTGFRPSPSELADEADGMDELSEQPMVEDAGDEVIEGEGSENKWQELLDSWKKRLEAIADEIRNGEAAVCFEDAKALAFCDVIPLLRLTERKIQFEESREAQL